MTLYIDELKIKLGLFIKRDNCFNMIESSLVNNRENSIGILFYREAGTDLFTINNSYIDTTLFPSSGSFNIINIHTNSFTNILFNIDKCWNENEYPCVISFS
jgi:hypothetical protein